MKVLYNGAVATRTYKDKYGVDKSVWRYPIEVCENDKGNKYLSVDAFFNFAALSREANSDRVFIPLFIPNEGGRKNPISESGTEI